jgi:hypothetical protein
MFFDKRINKIKSRQNNHGLAYSVKSKVIVSGYKGEQYVSVPVSNIELPGALII